MDTLHGVHTLRPPLQPVQTQQQPRGHQHAPIAPPTGLVIMVLLARIWNTKILAVKMDSLTVEVWAQQQLIAATALIRWKYVLLRQHPPNLPRNPLPLHPSRQQKW